MSMDLGTLLILGLIFMLSLLVTYFLGDYLLNIQLRKRLEIIKDVNYDEIHPLVSNSEQLARVLLERLVGFSMEDEKWESSEIRTRFLNAGYRSHVIILLYFGGKTILTLLLPMLYLLDVLLFSSFTNGAQIAMVAVALACIGFYLPNVLLALKIRFRKREIFENFPDALDLIRVCVSAGLGLDAAIAKVGEELAITSKALAEEFHLLSLELRAGATRDHALRNLATRTGVEDINALVGMLIQAEKFGTSVNDSLKVHAESLRSKRQIRAQEEAAKIPVKLTVPMILCILPAVFVVVLGPAVLGMIKNFSKAFG